MTVANFLQILIKAGLPALSWPFPHAAYTGCDLAFVTANWNAYVMSLPPELVTRDDLGALRPRYINGGVMDCAPINLGLMSWADTGNALTAVRSGQPRVGIGYGILFYQALNARPANFNAGPGGHCVSWFIDFDGQFNAFEGQVGLLTEMLLEERATASFGIAI